MPLRFKKRSSLVRRPVRRMPVKAKTYSAKSSFRPKRKIIVRRKTGLKLERLVPTITKMVKVFWDFEIVNQSIAANSNQTLTFWPMAATPFNGAAGSPIAVGDVPWQGLLQYSGIYTFGTILGASIKVVVANVGTTNNVKTILMPLNYYDYAGGPGSFSANSPSTIGALTYEQLAANPGNKHRVLGSFAGSKNQATLKMYRSSKKMLGVTSMKDTYGGSTGTTGHAFKIGTSSVHSTWTNPGTISNGWYYLLNTYNIDSVNAQVVNYSIRMEGYLLLSGANFLVETVLT
nr:MAG: capsid protein [Cressdnaviricota sp.]